MTVIAEEMEVTGIFNYPCCEGLKGNFVKWAPGCRPIEQKSGSVVQRLNPECVSKQCSGSRSQKNKLGVIQKGL